MIGGFISSTTNEALVPELGRNKPRTMRELLDLAMSQSSSEEAVRANFCKDQAEPIDEGKDCARREKGKKNSWMHHNSEFVAAVDRVHKQKTSRPNPVTFEKIIKSPCHNHGYLVEHNLEDYGLIK